MSLRGLPVRPSVLRIQPYSAPQEGRFGKLRLDFNENTIGCSPAVLRALRGLSARQISMYPEYQLATARIARALGVRPAELHLANGGDDTLRLIFDVFVEPGSTVLFPEPTFPMYRFFAELFGARTVCPRIDPEVNFPVGQILAALRRRPSVLFLANPNNPTGNLIAPAALRRTLRAARRTVVVLDEAYVEFSGWSAASWVRRHANLVVARTFSKASGIAGLRLGALIARPEIIELFRRVAPPFNVNAAALAAGEAALRDKAAIRRYVAEVRLARKEFAASLSRLGYRHFPSAGNFLLVDFGKRGPKIVKALARRGILLRDRGNEFGRPGFVRVSIGTRADMRQLAAALAKLGGKRRPR